MSNNILSEGIVTESMKHLHSFVKVFVEIENNNTYYLVINVNEYSAKYRLHPLYMRKKTYIMRVVSDLCIELARMCECERNCFYKVSEIDKVED